MKRLKQWKIVDWAGNEIDANGETFDSFDDAWSWIHEFIPEDETDDGTYDDYFVVEA